ncbi:MAG: hypothetical protein J7K69_03240 [Thermotogae bacterium]|nr:hypothetical protein [Thermotogota bacterium]
MSNLLIKSNIPLRIDQIDRLTHITTAITALREKKQDNERITKATVIRALIDSFDFSKLNLENIKNEGDLKERISAVINNNLSLEKFENFEKLFKEKIGDEVLNEIKNWLIKEGVLKLQNSDK